MHIAIKKPAFDASCDLGAKRKAVEAAVAAPGHAKRARAEIPSPLDPMAKTMQALRQFTRQALPKSAPSDTGAVDAKSAGNVPRPGKSAQHQVPAATRNVPYLAVSRCVALCRVVVLEYARGRPREHDFRCGRRELRCQRHPSPLHDRERSRRRPPRPHNRQKSPSRQARCASLDVRGQQANQATAYQRRTLTSESPRTATYGQQQNYRRRYCSRTAGSPSRRS